MFASTEQSWEEVPPPKPSSRSPLGRVACAKAHATALSSVGAEGRPSRQPFGCASRSLDCRPSAPEHPTTNTTPKQKGAQSATVLQAHRSMRICYRSWGSGLGNRLLIRSMTACRQRRLADPANLDSPFVAEIQDDRLPGLLRSDRRTGTPGTRPAVPHVPRAYPLDAYSLGRGVHEKIPIIEIWAG